MRFHAKAALLLVAALAAVVSAAGCSELDYGGGRDGGFPSGELESAAPSPDARSTLVERVVDGR